MTDNPEPITDAEVLENRIHAAIDQARTGGKVSHCTAIGVLELVKMQIYKEAIDQLEDDNDMEREYP